MEEETSGRRWRELATGRHVGYHCAATGASGNVVVFWWIDQEPNAHYEYRDEEQFNVEFAPDPEMTGRNQGEDMSESHINEDVEPLESSEPRRGLWAGMNAETFRLEADRLLGITESRWMIPAEEKKLLQALTIYIRSAPAEVLTEIANLVR